MASSCAGTSLGSGDCQAGNKPAYAGVNQGGGTVYAPSTTISGTGSYSISNGANWTQTPSGGAAPLDDPMSGKGPPPIPTVANEVPVPGGVINSTICPSGICSPGKDYATTTQSCGSNCTQQVASGDRGCERYGSFAAVPLRSVVSEVIFFGGPQAAGWRQCFSIQEFMFARVKPANNNTPGAC
jgi:hypothetical protein